MSMPFGCFLVLTPGSVARLFWMDSSLNWPATRAKAHKCNARVQSVRGMSESAFDPWQVVPVEGNKGVMKHLRLRVF
jgi:hypothetical protein